MRLVPSALPLLLTALMLQGCVTTKDTAGSTAASTATPEAAASTESYAMAIPIAPDQIDAWKALAAEITGPKREAHQKANEAVGITRELAWLQARPSGAVAVVYLEGTKLAESMPKRMASEDPHTKWFMEQVEKVHGLPPKADMVVNELVFKGELPGVEGETRSYALAAPIVAGKEAAFQALVTALQGEKKAAWEASRKAFGVKKEYVWLQKTPHGSVAVVYFEAKDPAKMMSAPPESDFDKWFMAELSQIHGFKMDAPPPMNEQLVK